MEKKKDCWNCVWHGKIVLGKLHCLKGPAEYVEPDCATGTFPHAENCTFYEGYDGSTNEMPENCPLCGEPVVLEVSGKGAVISCPKCDLMLGKRMHLTQSGAIKAWNRRA